MPDEVSHRHCVNTLGRLAPEMAGLSLLIREERLLTVSCWPQQHYEQRLEHLRYYPKVAQGKMYNMLCDGAHGIHRDCLKYCYLYQGPAPFMN